MSRIGGVEVRFWPFALFEDGVVGDADGFDGLEFFFGGDTGRLGVLGGEEGT